MASGFYIKHPHVISRNMYSVHFLAKILDRLLVWLVGLVVGVLSRFFDQVGHETMYASSGNKHFFE